MSDAGLYIRQGSKVQGPFAREKVRELAQSGRLKPDMELSSDRKTWQKAGAVKGLFDSFTVEAPPPPVAPAKKGMPTGGRVAIMLVLALAGLGYWWYFERVPPGVSLTMSIDEQRVPAEEAFQAAVKAVGPGDGTPAGWTALAEKIRTETLPAHRKLEARAASEASDDLGRALRVFLVARIAHLEAVERLGTARTPENIAAAQAAKEASRQAGSAWWQSIPEKYRASPYDPFSASNPLQQHFPGLRGN